MGWSLPLRPLSTSWTKQLMWVMKDGQWYLTKRSFREKQVVLKQNEGWDQADDGMQGRIKTGEMPWRAKSRRRRRWNQRISSLVSWDWGATRRRARSLLEITQRELSGDGLSLCHEFWPLLLLVSPEHEKRCFGFHEVMNAGYALYNYICASISIKKQQNICNFIFL